MEEGKERKNEELLDAWLRISMAIDNERVVSDMPYNKALICNLLYRNQFRQPQKYLTATDLCHMTRMLKSQMNRTLKQMEQKGILLRERSEGDKRQIFLQLNLEQANLYKGQHQKILAIIDRLIERLGEERIEEIIQLFQLIAEVAEEEIGERVCPQKK